MICLFSSTFIHGLEADQRAQAPATVKLLFSRVTDFAIDQVAKIVSPFFDRLFHAWRAS